MPFPYDLFIVFWGAAVLSGIAFLLYPSFRNRATKAATIRFGKQLQQNPALGETFAQTLYKPVGWIDVETWLHTKNLPTLISSLPSQVSDFFIHYRQRISEDSYLLVTTVNYSQPYQKVTILGPSPSYIGTRLTYNLNFVVQLDEFKKRIVVLSNQYTTLIEKNLQAGFATALSTILQL